MSVSSDDERARIQGERLEELLKSRKLKQVELLAMLNLRGDCTINKSTLSKYVNGSSYVRSPERRAAIADALGVRIGHIWPHVEDRIGAFANDLPFDLNDLGFYTIKSWTPQFRLLEARVAAPIEVRQGRQDWVDEETLRKAIGREHAFGGSPCPSLVRWQLDDGESVESCTLRLWAERSDYVQHRAIKSVLEGAPSRLDAIRRRITDVGLSAVMERAPRSNICCNVTIRAADGSLLFMQRPEQTRTHPYAWQVGPHETMNWSTHESPGGGSGPSTLAGEHPFDLVRRALKEEVNLDPPHYDEILISWFGVYLPELSGYFFAHVSTGLSKERIVERMKRAEHAWEARDIGWLPELKRSHIDAAFDIVRVNAALSGRQHGWLSSLTSDDFESAQRAVANGSDAPSDGGLTVITRTGPRRVEKLLPHALMSISEYWRIRAGTPP